MDDMPAFDPDDRRLAGGTAGLANAIGGTAGLADAIGGTAGLADAIGGTAGLADAIGGDSYRPAPTRQANGLVGKAQSHLFEIAENGKAELVQSVDGLVQIIRDAAAQAESFGFEPLSRYARQATAMVDDLHGTIRDRSVEDLIDDGRRIVRGNPEIALVAAAIIGFIGARILKAQE